VRDTYHPLRKEQLMSQTEKPLPFVMACKKYFGYKPGQGLKEFGEEVKELSQADREEMAPALAKLLDRKVDPGTA
jgi:hypothetical protein